MQLNRGMGVPIGHRDYGMANCRECGKEFHKDIPVKKLCGARACDLALRKRRSAQAYAEKKAAKAAA